MSSLERARQVGRQRTSASISERRDVGGDGPLHTLLRWSGSARHVCMRSSQAKGPPLLLRRGLRLEPRSVGRSPRHSRASRLLPFEPADAGHLAAQELVLRMAQAIGRVGLFELPTRDSSRDGRNVDVGLRDDRNRALILVEIWNRLDDLGGAGRSTRRKADEVSALAAFQGIPTGIVLAPRGYRGESGTRASLPGRTPSHVHGFVRSVGSVPRRGSSAASRPGHCLDRHSQRSGAPNAAASALLIAPNFAASD
jgi:hypothetical protein